MIYLVEDDNSIRELVAYTLKGAGFDTCGFEKPSDFWQAVGQKVPDLVLLDIMLPEEDGISVLKKMRKDGKTKKTPVLLLTAMGTEYDKVIGLDSGADDYLVKPFGMMELLARVRALLRRAGSQKEQEDFVLNELCVSRLRHEVKVSGQEVVLTFKEFELLCTLMENAGIVMTRDKLLNKVWGYDFDGENRTVDVHVRTLRQKLRECGNYIETVRGIGYKIG